MNEAVPTPRRNSVEADGSVWVPANGSNDIPLLTQYLRIAMRWKWVIIGTTVAAFLIGLVSTMLMTRQYTAATTVEIAREADRVVKSEGVERETTSADLEFYQTQYGLLKARSLAERVARELKLADDPKFFEAFGIDVNNAGLFVDNSNRPLGLAGRERRQKSAAGMLLGNIGVAPVRASRLTSISFTSPDPALSAKIANAWAENFIESNLERRFERNSYARKYLEGRLEQLRLKLEESERALVGYAQAQQIISIPTAGSDDNNTIDRPIAADDLSAINTELAAATADRIRAESAMRQSGGGGSVTEALANNAISVLRQRRAEIAAEYAKLMVQFEPGYPAAKALESQIAQLDRSIAREESRVRDTFGTEYRQALARERALQQRVESLKSGLLDLRRRSIQYNIYQRDADTNRQLYDGLLQRYKEIGVAGGVGSNNVSIVDRAEVPGSPSSPRLMLNLLFSLLAGLGLGAVLAFALEQIDEAINDPGEVERKLGVPLLGAVPKTHDQEPVDALQDRKSSIVEAYLSVQTNLEFATVHGAPRSLAVTSTRPAEGKSTSAYALSLSLARARRKVVLVDGDMRSPSVNGLFGVKNEKGLSNYLTGSENVAELIMPTSFEGLAIMPAGPQPPNAAELLTGNRLETLIAELLKTFDHVVIDSPPVMGLADAPLIASQVEGTIVAVETGGIRSSLVKVAMNRLVAANARILGVILTKFESKRAHYGYGYDYGYGYGDKKSAT